MLRAAARRVALAGVLIRRPDEFVERVRKDLELVADRVAPRRATYDPCEWDEVLEELCARFPDAERVSHEPELREIEDAVGATLSATAGSRPWDELRYSCDPVLARCAYVLCRILCPAVVVETGVAYGLSSAYLLQALARNGEGVLESVDLPPLGGTTDFVGLFVPATLRGRWRLHRGTSRRLLPGLVEGRRVGLFLHDSLHTYATMRWELATVWPHLVPGGAVIADDIQGNAAFAELAREASFARVVREPGKPVLFGIALR